MYSNKQAKIFFFVIVFPCSFFNTLLSNDINFPITRSQPWRPVQEQVRDTVIQVFSQIAEFNWLQPYSTPQQYGVRGSGFFISDDGYIVTNAHVVDQSVVVWIQIPSLGKRPIKVDVVGICPDKDLALLKLTPESLIYVRAELGRVPFLPLGNSDDVRRADEVLALGYPLGQESLKSTTGIISGREQHLIQISAPINPGNSGGPLLNMDGYVIGINSSGIVEAQSVGYAIPVKDLLIIMPDLVEGGVLRKPFLGLLSARQDDRLTAYLGNPLPGGCYVVDVTKDGPLAKAGIEAGDMIYEINGCSLDIYGEMSVPWSEDKVSFTDFISRLEIGENVHVVFYRKGERRELTLVVEPNKTAPIPKVYPWFEEVDYEVFGGMVVMPLTVNHIIALAERVPGLRSYENRTLQSEPALLITHIFPSSELAYSRVISPGFTIDKVNNIKVFTLEDYRKAIKTSLPSGNILIQAVDQLTHSFINVPVVLSLKDSVEETLRLAPMYRYPISDFVNELNALLPQTNI